MAVDDLSANNPPTVMRRSSALPAAGTMREITLPTWVRKVTVALKAADQVTDDSGWIAVDEQTDGVAVDKSEAFPVASGGALSFAMTPGRSRGSSTIYVTGDTAAGYCYLVLEASEVS